MLAVSMKFRKHDKVEHNRKKKTCFINNLFKVGFSPSEKLCASSFIEGPLKMM